MNIRGIDNPIRDALQRIEAYKQDKATQQTRTNVGKDSANTSSFSRLMAKSAQDLAEEMGIRQSKVAQFKDFANTPVDLSNVVVSTIARRMTVS